MLKLEPRLERVEEALRWMVPRDDGMAPAPGEEDASSIEVSQRVDYLVQRLDEVEQATSKSINDLEQLMNQRPEIGDVSGASLSRLGLDVRAMVAAEIAKAPPNRSITSTKPSSQHELLDARHSELRELMEDSQKIISAIRLENETLREAVVASNAALTLSAAHINRIRDASPALGSATGQGSNAIARRVEVPSSSAEDMRAIRRDLASLCTGMDTAGGMLGVQGRSLSEASLTLCRPDVDLEPSSFSSSPGEQVETELKRVRKDLANLVAWLQSAGDVLADRGRAMISSAGDASQGRAPLRL